MKRILAFCSVIVFILISACQLDVVSNDDLMLPVWVRHQYKVLFISSYDPSFPTFFLQVDGLQSVFQDQKILLDIEFMDTKRFPEPENTDNFYQSLVFKMNRIAPYDAIIVGDDAAFQFGLDHQQDLFLGVPIVFFGVNDKEMALAQNQNPDVTGVVEAVSMKETIDLMLKLHPNVHQVVALVDGTVSGQADLHSFYQVAETFHDDISFIDLSLEDYTFAEYTQKLQELDENSVVILLSLYEDKTGQTVLFEEGLELVSSNLKSPLYSLWYHGLGDGVIGGKVINHYVHAQQAAGLVLRILDGVLPQDIPVLENSPNQYVFDYQKVEEFNIPHSLLPASRQFINEPGTFFYKYHELTLFVLGFVIFQAIIIAALIVSARRRKVAENALLAERAVLETRVAERTAELQKANEELVEADRAKDVFLANMSHELRTPLTAILGMSEILSEQVGVSMDARQLKYVNTIHDSGEHLLSLINDILDVSRMRIGKLDPYIASVSIVELCQSAIMFVQESAHKNNIDLSFENQSEVEVIQADLRMMKQVLVNILTNAIKFTPQRGHVGLLVQSDLEKQITRFTVWDDGIGISLDQQTRIFETFYQVDSSLARKHDGAGLGLALVKHILALHNGSITCESDGVPGKGSRFIVVLPMGLAPTIDLHEEV